MHCRVCLTGIVAAGGNAGAIERSERRVGLAGPISWAGQDAGTLATGWRDRGERLVVEMIFICQDPRIARLKRDTR